MEKAAKKLQEDGWKILASYWEAEMFHTLLVKDGSCLVFNETLDKPLTKSTRICDATHKKKIVFFHHENEGIANSL